MACSYDEEEKNFVLVILKVLKAEVNWFEWLADKGTAEIAVDSQGQLVKDFSTNGEVGKLESGASSAWQNL